MLLSRGIAVKTVVLLTCLMICSGAYKPTERVIKYNFPDGYSKHLEDEILNIHKQAWPEFLAIVGTSVERDGVTRLVATNGKADINIYSNVHPAIRIADMYTNGAGRRMIRICYPQWMEYPEQSRVRMLIHEYMHLYYGLPDEYYPNSVATDGVTKKDCIMSNFHVYGWSGRLCEDCKNIIRKVTSK